MAAKTQPIMPMALEAEESVVGGVLVHPRKMADVRPSLDANDFGEPRSRIVYQALVELFDAGKPIDAISVRDVMRSRGDLDRLPPDVDGYLTGLMAKVVTVENLGYHAKLVRDTAKKRMLKQLLARRVRDVDVDEDIDDLMERTAIEIGNIKREPMSLPLIAASAVRPEPVEWLWRGRIAKGMISIFDGDPGLGKSTVTNDLIARHTCGLPFPGDATGRAPAKALIISYEDTPSHVIVPRLIAAGADLNHVELWDQSQPLVLPDELDKLARVVEERAITLVVIDPFMAALASTINAHRDQDVRRVMGGLASVAAKTEAAVLLVRHLNKLPGGKALYRGGGSIGIIGAARAAFMLEEDPDGRDAQNARVLAVTKCNLGTCAPSLTLSIVEAPPLKDYRDVKVSKVQWTGVSNRTADELLASGEEQSAMDEAMTFLQRALAGGKRPSKEVIAEATGAGISLPTLNRAKRKLRVRADDDRDSNTNQVRGWTWSLENHVSNEDL